MSLTRAIRKVLIDPFRYGITAYDAERFWRDRHTKYGLALRGSGNEAWSEADNKRQNDEDRVRLLGLLRVCGRPLGSGSVLEVGCGCGVYADACQDAGVPSYIGVDITDALFPSLTQAHPEFRFVKRDCTKPGGLDLGARFDVVLAISVIEHITARPKLDAALANMRRVLADGGLLFVGPVSDAGGLRLFYHRVWREKDVLAGFDLCGRVSFRGGQLLALRAQAL